MTPRFGLSLTPLSCLVGPNKARLPPSRLPALSPLSAIAAAPTTLFLARPTSGDSAGRWVGRPSRNREFRVLRSLTPSYLMVRLKATLHAHIETEMLIVEGFLIGLLEREVALETWHFRHYSHNE